MLNHARTLLMNVAGSNYFFDYIGEELVDPTYRAKSLPGYLVNLRRMLFGNSPDREMLNYRCRQYLSLLHSTELVEFVTELDSRITYDFEDNPFFDESLYQLKVSPVLLSAADLPVSLVADQDTPPDASGILRKTWQVSYTGGDTVDVTYSSGNKVLTDSSAVAVEDGLTEPVRLPGSFTQIRLTASSGPDRWYLRRLSRPQYDVGEIASSLIASGESATSQLFGVGSGTAASEPFKTFKNLWEQHPELGYKLGGLLLAVIYRTEEL